MRSTRRVASGATLRKTETVPRVLCFMASIDDPSIAEKRNGTVHPHLWKVRADGECAARLWESRRTLAPSATCVW